MTKEEFLKDIGAWSNHRRLLWMALRSALGPILELGAGEGSTPYLRQFCDEHLRSFQSYDSNKEWAKKMQVNYNNGDWESLSCWHNPLWGVVLLDLAPGEYRRVALMKLTAQIIIIHDSEPPRWNASDYKVRPLFKNFKYVIDDKPKEKGAPWTTAVSNTVDVSKWKI